jgi:hypothetical protein
MTIIKSIALGLGMFFIGTVAYLLSRLVPTAGPNKATGLSVLEGYTIYNVWYWVACVTTFGIAYWIVRRVSTGA